MASSTALEDWNVSLWVCPVYTVTRDAVSSDTTTVEDEALGCEGTVRARCRNTNRSISVYTEGVVVDERRSVAWNAFKAPSSVGSSMVAGMDVQQAA
jgi:hypothetical protein